MGRKSKINKGEKIKACKDYMSGKRSIIEIASILKSTKTTVWRWIKVYEKKGKKAFDEKSRNASYTADFKLQVVNEYLTGLGSSEDLAVQYDISNSMVLSWLKLYNRGIEIKDYDPKGDVYTMKKRITTLEEKIEIIEYVIENNYDYKGAADKYSVPYANVFSWVKKYEKDKENGLADKRGRPTLLDVKPKELSEVEKLQIELKKEKLKNERLERAIVALKKNEEIRNRLIKDSRKSGK